MSRELDELSERYSILLAEHKSSPDAPHITWVGAREVLRRAVSEAYELGRYTLEQDTRVKLSSYSSCTPTAQHSEISQRQNQTGEH